MDDVEMIDLEKEASPKKGEKRKLNNKQPPEFGKSPVESGKIKPVTLKRVVQARRTLPRNRPNVNKKDPNKAICIVDTNILLSHLNSFKSLLLYQQKQQKQGVHDVRFRVPWVVFYELDRQKKDEEREVRKEASSAIHFLEEQGRTRKSEDSLIDKEKPTEVVSDIKLIEEEVNDDKIINCCLKVHRQFDKVILLTNDVNLRVRVDGIADNISAMGWVEFEQVYGDKVSKQTETRCKKEEAEEHEPQVKRVKRVNNCPSTKASCDYKFSSPILPQTFRFATEQQTSFYRSSQSPNFGAKTEIEYSNNSVLTQKKLDYNEWIDFKYDCEKKLMMFFEAAFKENFKNDTIDGFWKQMMTDEIDPEKATFKDMIRLLKKEWSGSFSDFFKRDSVMKSHIDNIHQKLLKNYDNYDDYLDSLRYVIDKIEKVNVSISR